MGQEKASLVAARTGGPAAGHVATCSGARARLVVVPRERACRARYACARGLGARRTEVERRRRGGGRRAPFRLPPKNISLVSGLQFLKLEKTRILSN
nr:uncharacterized protein LOC102904452 [Peromyscus maniculatus bairdii]